MVHEPWGMDKEDIALEGFSFRILKKKSTLICMEANILLVQKKPFILKF